MIAVSNKVKLSTRTVLRLTRNDFLVKSSSFAVNQAVLRCGMDLVDLDDFARSIQLGRERFLSRIYTSGERAFCRGRTARLATRFAAKEATAKLLGTGIRNVGWQEIEVISLPHGEPTLVLHGRASLRAKSLGLRRISLSLCHTRTTAAALAIGICSVRQDEREA